MAFTHKVNRKHFNSFMLFASLTLPLCLLGTHLHAQQIIDKASDSALIKKALIEEARANTTSLEGALKHRLQQAIKSGGLEAGVDECHLAAEPIALDLSNNGWTVGRTALKVRNPNNTPDDWEREQLKVFAQVLNEQLQQHEKAPATAPLEATQYNEITGEFRYMRAIPTQQVCMACHGEIVAPSVKARIDKHYPHDQATGFTLGELRGAFTLAYSPQ
ncbi:DUF3365 domain-containing protein [Alteromonas sp. McT4-15]|uniref:Tll0287-like domain-containing protein n=1 Tax=Alteromonas sp. McT4-15 TaxID=2881256 RepID=UPI001CF8ED30|nr:DUF3365 domain-containing protein [Alteromonas sp. McT4-15]MCB4434867.1 DUF3365 domain-containing protein [Alteromonas sp. McT4-15]